MKSSKNYTYLTKEPNRQDRVRLFCFPYAGGGAKTFREWDHKMPSGVGVYPVQYPGRENRMGEKPIEDLQTLVQEVYGSLKNVLNDGTPYIFYGHSLGTKVVYELTRLAEKEDLTPPLKVIVSAGRAPHYIEPKPIYHLPDDDFIHELKRFSGTPVSVLENRDLMNIFLPMLRADFKVDETYRKNQVDLITTPIHGIMGSEDQEMDLPELLAWKDYTSSEFTYETIQGPHLFVDSNPQDLINTLSNQVLEILNV